MPSCSLIWWHALESGLVLNLEKKPDINIQIGDQLMDVHAVITQGEERNHLYERFKSTSSNFVKYEKGTSQVIPVIRLVPH